MAKVTFNSSVASVRGKMDRWVYREQHGQTVLLPLRSYEDRPTPAQLDHRSRFSKAQAYAAEVMADPLKRECYRKLGLARKRPPNALLISNFLTPPTIDQVDLSAYAGNAGDRIRVLATDAIEVVAVTMVVRGADGLALENGPAAKDHDLWVYRCTTALAKSAVAIEVTAQNRARAVATETITLG